MFKRGEVYENNNFREGVKIRIDQLLGPDLNGGKCFNVTWLDKNDNIIGPDTINILPKQFEDWKHVQ